MATILGNGITSAAQTTERGELAVAVLRQCLDPRNHKMAPPSFSTRTSFSQSVELNMEYEVPLASDLVNESCPHDTGAVLWFLNQGVDSIFHCGFAPIGAVSYFESMGLRPWPRVNCVNNRFLSLTYTAPLLLPYGGSDGVYQAAEETLIQLAPALEKNFSRTRLYGGAVMAETLTDAKIFENYNQNGRFSVGAIADTRDIAQIYQGTGWTAYSQTNLATSSITSKEAIKSCPANRGIVTLVGPDSAPTFSSPNHQNNDILCSEFSVINVPLYADEISMPMTGLFSAFPPDQTYGTHSAWITPWQISAQVIPTAVSSHSNIQLPAIDETGCLDIDMYFPELYLDGDFSTIQAGSPGFVGDTNQADFVVQFSNVYAAIGKQGRIIYNTEVTTCTKRLCDFHTLSINGGAINPITGNFTPAPDASKAGNSDNFTARSRPRMQADHSASGSHQASFTRVGKYVGTFVQYYARYSGTYLHAGPNCKVVVPAQPLFRIRARSVDMPGACGPCRVLRYDNLNEKDTLRIDGILNVQCVPQSSLAPFTQSASMFNPETSDFNMLPWLVLMFNSSTELKRNWTKEEYFMLMQQLGQLTSIERIVEWSARDEKLRVSGQAAGLFSDIASFGGNLLGGLVGRPQLGEQAGQWLGSKADNFLGTGGVSVSGLDSLGRQGGLLGKWTGRSGGQFGDGGYGVYRGRESASAASYM